MVEYPGSDVVGNDGRSFTDEDPVTIDYFYEGIAGWPQGELRSRDAPAINLAHSAGENDHEYELRLEFGEFVRLEIGDAWFRVSDFVDWHFFARLKRQWGTWEVDSMGASAGSDPSF